MNDGKLLAKSKAFAKEIVLAMRNIRNIEREYVMTDQLLRSGTSIGANVYESTYAQGRLDFISKLEIALKECYESEYWLDLLFETNYLKEQTYRTLKNDCGAIRKNAYQLLHNCQGRELIFLEKFTHSNHPQLRQRRNIIAQSAISLPQRGNITVRKDNITA